MSLASRYQQASSALETLDGLMQRPSDHEHGRQYLHPEDFKGKLTADGIEFSYPGEHKVRVLNGVSITVQAGQHLALLGKVGSGKSTFLRLMAGLYSPTEGSVQADDMDLRQIKPAVLRAHIGYVGQEPQLFEVLKKLDLYDLIESHPLGLDMPLTEAGGGLSGGQRQLIAIARMMVRDPVYVFMDEPTSHMDKSTESHVIEVLKDWLEGRTLILATHRLSLLYWVERVAVFERGRCLAEGPRDDIMRQISRGAEIARNMNQQASGAVIK